MGDLLLGGGGGLAAVFLPATVDIVPDARLNALIVHAKTADLDTIEQLLKVLDQRTGPEDVEAETQPRPIPVYNTTASEIADIVQQVYADRMAGSNGVMSPQDMMKMIRGGNNAEQQIPKMSVAVDTRNNLLIVRAPDPLFDEVKSLVANLDQALLDSPETTRVVSLKHTNSSAVQRALTSILNNVNTNTTDAQGGDRRGRNNDEDSPEDRARRAMRRNWEMMQEMRRMQGDGDRGGRRWRWSRRRRSRWLRPRWRRSRRIRRRFPWRRWRRRRWRRLPWRRRRWRRWRWPWRAGRKLGRRSITPFAIQTVAGDGHRAEGLVGVAGIRRLPYFPVASFAVTTPSLFRS